jgi:hypothetical protein
MILKEFKPGWQIAFEERIQFLFTLWPDIKLTNINRSHGMLRIKLETLDKQVQYILDSVSYKIERESAHTCEECGTRGVRREEFLSEKMCLCWKCYALEVDAIEANNK